MKARQVFIIIATIILAAYVPVSAAMQEKPMVIGTSIYPLYDMIKNIAGPRAEVFYVIPPGANPHTFEPVPSIVRKLSRASVYVAVHKDFDRSILPLVPGSARVLYLFNREESEYSDPHVWLSVQRARTLCSAVAAFLTDLYPSQKELIRENRDSYCMQLTALDKELTQLFEPVRSQSFIQLHQAWDRFADDYGLAVAGTIEKGHGKKPSVREFKELVTLARQNNVQVIVMGLQTGTGIAEALKRETGSALVRLDTIGGPGAEGRETYIGLMRFNGTRLAAAMAGTE